MRITLLIVLSCIVQTLCAQTLTITGPSTAAPGSQQTYVAEMGIRRNYPGAMVTWNVTGGTILSQITSPIAPTVYCIVQWGTRPGNYILSVSVNIPAQSGKTLITVTDNPDPCPQANAGDDVTICAGGSAMIGMPPAAGYSYSWYPTTGLDNPISSQVIASPAQTTTYTLKLRPQNPNLLINWDFENDHAGFGTDYQSFPSDFSGTGEQAITTSPGLLSPDWCNITDYSTNGTHMLVVRAPAVNPADSRLWYATQTVQPGRYYNFSFFVAPVSPYPSRVRVTLTGNNTGPMVNEIDLPAPAGAFCGRWLAYGTSWGAGTNTQVTIDLRCIPAGPEEQRANELAFDDMSFIAVSDCPNTTDQVTVIVGAPPQVTPAGPVDYYYLWENGMAKMGLTLTSAPQSSYQWYRNGVLLEGETAQTYKAKTDGAYTVRNAGCESNAVTFRGHPYGYDQVNIGETIYPAGINSPLYYCYNSTNVIRQFDLGPAATYAWETYTEGARPQLSLNTSGYDIHSPQAEVIINPDNTGITSVLGYAVQPDGYVKAMEFNHHYYTPYTSAPSYACIDVTLPVQNSSFSRNIDPGASGFDWETYDAGPTGTIITPDPALYPDPADPANRHKIRIPGKHLYAGGIRIAFSSLPATLYKYFYSDNGDCYRETKNYTEYCRGGFEHAISLYPNPAKNSVTITAPDEILSIEISGINSPVQKQTLQKNSGTKTLQVNIFAYRPGIYNCRITTIKGIFNEKLVIAP